MTEENKKVASLISMGVEIAGVAVGGALGFLAGGPLTAAGAGVVGLGVTRVLHDLTKRYLSDREATRVGATAATAIALIKDRLENGERLRQDGFFRAEENRRSAAEEVFEGVLLAAKNSHEEKKTHYLGRLFANSAFDTSCSADELNYQLHVADSLTFAQFVILRICSSKGYTQFLRGTPYGARTQVYYETLSLLHAIRELCGLDLVHMQGPQDEHHTIVLGINEICPAHLHLAVGGERLHKLLGLSAIPVEDIESIAKWLR